MNIYFYVGSTSVVEESFGYLDAPVERIAGADIPMPYAANLERMAVPQVHFPTFSKSLLSFFYPDKFTVLSIEKERRKKLYRSSILYP